MYKPVDNSNDSDSHSRFGMRIILIRISVIERFLFSFDRRAIVCPALVRIRHVPIRWVTCGQAFGALCESDNCANPMAIFAIVQILHQSLANPVPSHQPCESG